MNTLVKVTLLLLFLNSVSSITFPEVIENLSILENYVAEFHKSTSSTYTTNHLTLCFIRKGRYKSVPWSIAGGLCPDELDDYIIEQDKKFGTHAYDCRKYADMEAYNQQKIDFVHLFAVMNGIENGNSTSAAFAHLVGWGGDCAQLFQDISKAKGTLEELMEEAKKFFKKKGGFDEADLISDLDAPIIYMKKLANTNKKFAEIMTEYYQDLSQINNRIKEFVRLTFPELKQKDKVVYRDHVFNVYSSDLFLRILECTFGFREEGLGCVLPGDIKPEYANHEKASVYTFSDFLYENYN